MQKLHISDKTYPLKITLGVIEDLEARGYDLDSITGGQFSIKLMLDLIELAAGVDRETLRSLSLKDIEKLAGPVAAAINESFKGGPDPEPADGSDPEAPQGE